jgi:hypothetical protein
MIKTLSLAAALGVAACPVWAAKSCDELKTEIAAKLDGKNVTGYDLEIVAADQADKAAEGGRIVGSCEGGTKKIVYKKK